MSEAFFIGESVRYGFSTAKAEWKRLVPLMLVAAVISVVPGQIGGLFEEAPVWVGIGLGIVSWIMQLMMGMALIKLTIMVYDDEPWNMSALMLVLRRRVLPFALTSILYGLIVIGGFILLIVPGIIWSIKYRFAPYIVLDHEVGPREALRRSGKMTKGYRWDLLGLQVVLGVVTLIGALALGVGLLLAVPTTLLAQVWVYRRLGESHRVTVDDLDNLPA